MLSLFNPHSYDQLIRFSILSILLLHWIQSKLLVFVGLYLPNTEVPFFLNMCKCWLPGIGCMVFIEKPSDKTLYFILLELCGILDN